MADKKVVPMPDLELEAQLKKYQAMKQARKTAENGMLADFTEADDDSVTINQTYGEDTLEIEEDDEDE